MGGELRTADWTSNPDLVAPAHTHAVSTELTLDSGAVLPHHVANFETYGTLSPARDNAVLVLHSLTSDAHAAGRRGPDDPRAGWWDAAIGPGLMLDTDRHFVISVDTLAAGHSTGPASTDPGTGVPYALGFPVVTVRDMVRAQRQLLADLGIERLHAVIGGCFGGQQALEWVITYPDLVENAVVITTTPATSAHTIAIFSVMRHLIRTDPDWRGGDYYGRSAPSAGLNAAVAAAVPLWMSRQAMGQRFGRATVPGRGYAYTLDAEFEVEQFIARLADRAGHELDANGLMYLMRAVEYFDLEHEYGGLERAFAEVSARVLFVSYRGDWRYPPAETARMARALRAAGGRSGHAVLASGLGHGAFLYDVSGLSRVVTRFLAADAALGAARDGGHG